jgi:MFS family permease
MTSEAAQPTALIDDSRAKRNVIVLASAQAIGGAASPMNIAMSALAGFYLLGADKSLATLPITAFVLGTACAAAPAAMLMRRVGRRPGFITGMLIGTLGGLTQAAAVGLHSFWLLAFGAFLSGSTSAFVQQFRFAATDTSSAAFRPKAISWVLAGGIFAAVIGPQTVIFSQDLLDPLPFAGAYIGAAVLTTLAALVLLNLDIPKPAAQTAETRGRPLMEIALTSNFIIAVMCAICAYALMALVMTAAPLAMVSEGHHQDMATLGIQWHVIAMFAPSFFTGTLIVRYGAESIVAVGMVLLLGCASVALAGVSIAHYWAALILLGVGWNFGFIGGTALVTETYWPEEKERVQALNDALVFGFVALASLSSGQLLVLGGWNLVNLAVFPVAVFCLFALAVLHIRRKRGLG